MIDLGIVGIQGYAQVWLANLARLEAEGIVRLRAAVVNEPEGQADRMAALEGAGCRLYASYDDLLASEVAKLDVIGLPIAIDAHGPLAVRALRAGYHAVVEKPLAPTVQEVGTLRRAERETGRWCAVGYQWLHSPTIQWLRHKLAQGQLGALQRAVGMIGWPRDRNYYERNKWAGKIAVDGHWVLDGPATNATAHYLTNLLYLWRAQARDVPRPGIASVEAELYRAKPIASYDTSCIHIAMDDGARLLHLVSHSLERPHEPIMRLECERATVIWTAENDRAVIHHSGGRSESYRNAHPERNSGQPLRDAALALARGDRPLCGTVEAAPQVLAVNLAFESSRGVQSIPTEHVRQRYSADGSPLVTIAGMEQALLDAYRQGETFSELGLSWAHRGQAVAAQGYDCFPESRELEKKLLANGKE